MDDYGRGRSRMRLPVSPCQIRVRSCEGAVGGPGTRRERPDRAVRAGRHARREFLLVTGAGRGDRSTSEISLSKCPECIAIFRHELAALRELSLNFRIIGSEEIAFRSFYREKAIVLLDLEARQHFFGQQDTGGSSYRA